jgi:hypothetical protein
MALVYILLINCVLLLSVFTTSTTYAVITTLKFHFGDMGEREILEKTLNSWDITSIMAEADRDVGHAL